MKRTLVLLLLALVTVGAIWALLFGVNAVGAHNGTPAMDCSGLHVHLSAYNTGGTNHITVAIDSVTIVDQNFSSSFNHDYALDAALGHSAHIVVTAWDDPTSSHGWSFVWDRSIDPCVTHTPTPTSTPSSTATDTPTATATETLTPTNTATLTPSDTPTATLTNSWTPVPSETPQNTPSATRTMENSPTPYETAQSSPTVSATPGCEEDCATPTPPMTATDPHVERYHCIGGGYEAFAGESFHIYNTDGYEVWSGVIEAKGEISMMGDGQELVGRAFAVSINHTGEPYLLWFTAAPDYRCDPILPMATEPPPDAAYTCAGNPVQYFGIARGNDSLFFSADCDPYVEIVIDDDPPQVYPHFGMERIRVPLAWSSRVRVYIDGELRYEYAAGSGTLVRY